MGARVRVLAATAPGLLPRLATSCGETKVTAFDPRTREYTVKPLALHSRPQTKIPEVAVVAPSRDGNEEMYSRGGARSSEGAKAVVQAERRAAQLEKQVEQLRVRTERAEKKAKVATGKAAASEANAAAVAAAESLALFSGNRRDPQLPFLGAYWQGR